MIFISVRCLHCHSEQIVKRGKTGRGTQRSLCQNTALPKGVFCSTTATEGVCPRCSKRLLT
jgi:hypothetical protein